MSWRSSTQGREEAVHDEERDSPPPTHVQEEHYLTLVRDRIPKSTRQQRQQQLKQRAAGNAVIGSALGNLTNSAGVGGAGGGGMSSLLSDMQLLLDDSSGNNNNKKGGGGDEMSHSSRMHANSLLFSMQSAGLSELGFKKRRQGNNKETGMARMAPARPMSPEIFDKPTTTTATATATTSTTATTATNANNDGSNPVVVAAPNKPTVQTFNQFRRWQEVRVNKRRGLDGPRTARAGRGDGGGTPGSSSGGADGVEGMWVPGINPEFMERVFAKDVRKHVEASNSRVSFCKCGGSCNDDDFSHMEHHSEISAYQNAHSPRPPAASSGKGKGKPQPSVKREQLQEGEKKAQIKQLQQAPHTARSVVSSAIEPRETSTTTSKVFELTHANVAPATISDGSSSNKLVAVATTDSNTPTPTSNRQQQAHSITAEVPVPWTTRIGLQHLKHDVRPSKLSRLYVLLYPNLTPEMISVANIIGSTNEDFRKMVEYRRQDTQRRYEAVLRDNEGLRATPAQRQLADALFDSALEVHPRFQRLVRDDKKSFYQTGGQEIDRWNDDRKRLFETKFRCIDVHETESTWQRALLRIRQTISNALEREFVIERSQLQSDFFNKFQGEVDNLFSSYSAEGRRQLEKLRVLFNSDVPFGAREMNSFVREIPTDGFFLDDVLSIVYSLGRGLDLAEKCWLLPIRERTQMREVHREALNHELRQLGKHVEMTVPASTGESHTQHPPGMSHSHRKSVTALEHQHHHHHSLGHQQTHNASGGGGVCAISNEQTCCNYGCLKKFCPSDSDLTCRHHRRGPFCIGQYKFWACCPDKRCADIQEFFAIPGCVIGEHQTLAEFKRRLEEEASASSPLASARNNNNNSNKAGGGETEF